MVGGIIIDLFTLKGDFFGTSSRHDRVAVPDLFSK